MRKDYQPGVLQTVRRIASQVAACDGFNGRRALIHGLVVPRDLTTHGLSPR
jgi:hypothetical protein